MAKNGKNSDAIIERRRGLGFNRRRRTGQPTAHSLTDKPNATIAVGEDVVIAASEMAAIQTYFAPAPAMQPASPSRKKDRKAMRHARHEGRKAQLAATDAAPLLQDGAIKISNAAALPLPSKAAVHDLTGFDAHDPRRRALVDNSDLLQMATSALTPQADREAAIIQAVAIRHYDAHADEFDSKTDPRVLFLAAEMQAAQDRPQPFGNSPLQLHQAPLAFYRALHTALDSGQTIQEAAPALLAKHPDIDHKELFEARAYFMHRQVIENVLQPGHDLATVTRDQGWRQARRDLSEGHDVALQRLTEPYLVRHGAQLAQPLDAMAQQQGLDLDAKQFGRNIAQARLLGHPVGQRLSTELLADGGENLQLVTHVKPDGSTMIGFAPKSPAPAAAPITAAATEFADERPVDNVRSTMGLIAIPAAPVGKRENKIANMIRQAREFAGGLIRPVTALVGMAVLAQGAWNSFNANKAEISNPARHNKIDQPIEQVARSQSDTLATMVAQGQTVTIPVKAKAKLQPAFALNSADAVAAFDSSSGPSPSDTLDVIGGDVYKSIPFSQQGLRRGIPRVAL